MQAHEARAVKALQHMWQVSWGVWWCCRHAVEGVVRCCVGNTVRSYSRADTTAEVQFLVVTFAHSPVDCAKACDTLCCSLNILLHSLPLAILCCTVQINMVWLPGAEHICIALCCIAAASHALTTTVAGLTTVWACTTCAHSSCSCW